MKAVCIKSYYDKCLHRSMTPGDELEVTEERFVELSGRKVVKKKEVSDVEYTQESAYHVSRICVRIRLKIMMTIDEATTARVEALPTSSELPLA